METTKQNSVALPTGQTTGSATGSVASTAATRSRVDRRTILVTVVVALAVWLPRGFELNRFVTIDESKWVVRSANYYEALAHGNLIDTFQQGHPGVIVMYAGMAGYLWKFPDYVNRVNIQHKWGDPFMDMLLEMGHRPIDLLVAGRIFIVFFNVVALTLAFLYARRLVGLWPALAGFLLIAFDPFHIALSRLLHPDGLLSTLMLLATLAFMAYLFAGRRTPDLIAAGVYTALAWLTKTPAIFLIPLVGLLTLIELAIHVTRRSDWRWRDFVQRTALWRLLRTWLIWGGAALLACMALWPALWVAPLWTLSRVFSISESYALEGHDSSVFFNGQIYNGDPGFWFYPINYLWRTTPVVMIGLVLLIGAFLWRGTLARRRTITLTLLGLLASAFFFNVFMTLGAKKFDRYLLPVFMPLDFAAALGWVAMLTGLATWRRVAWGRYAAAGLAVGAIGLQAGLAINTYPYYMSYYNPVMGGADRAEEVMFIGWGEGLDEAARYLNKLPDAKKTTVASWYERGPFSYFYNGTSSSSQYTWESDYATVYNHQWQRQRPNRRMLAYFDTLTPIHTIRLDGIEYVKIYNMREAPPGDYTVAWGNAINLMHYEMPTGTLHPGQLFEMVIYFLKSAPIDIDYKIKLRIVSQEGHTLLLQESKPRQVNTSEWKVGEVLIDDTYVMVVPEETPSGLYRIEISFYDPDTLDHLPAVQVNNGQALNDPYILDYLVIGDWPPVPQIKVEPPVILGDEVALEGAAMLDATGKEQTLAGKSFAAGESIPIRLHWRAQKFIHSNYTNFVHVVGPDGSLITQADRLPLDGFIPTSYWPPQQVMGDNYLIQLPDDAPSGEYHLLVGWYQLETLARLPMSQGNKAIGDAYQVATFTVR